MLRPIRRLLAVFAAVTPLLAGAAIVGVAPPVGAFETMSAAEGVPIVWMHDRVAFYLDADGTDQLPMADVQRTLREVLATWSEVDGTDLSLELERTVAGREVGYQGEDDVNLVAFEDAAWRFNDGALAITLSTWRVPSGELLDADILVNSVDYDWALDGRGRHFDLAAALAHELGHAVGLGHSDVGTATMYASMAPSETTKRDLDADDLAGYRYLYGSSDVIVAPSPGPGGVDDRLEDPVEDPGADAFGEPSLDWPSIGDGQERSSGGMPSEEIGLACALGPGQGSRPDGPLMALLSAVVWGLARRRTC